MTSATHCSQPREPASRQRGRRGARVLVEIGANGRGREMMAEQMPIWISASFTAPREVEIEPHGGVDRDFERLHRPGRRRAAARWESW